MREKKKHAPRERFGGKRAKFKTPAKKKEKRRQIQKFKKGAKFKKKMHRIRPKTLKLCGKAHNFFSTRLAQQM